jgi:hypothetical protein
MFIFFTIVAGQEFLTHHFQLILVLLLFISTLQKIWLNSFEDEVFSHSETK